MIQYLPPETVTVAQHIFQQPNTSQPTQQNQMQDNDEMQHDSNHDEQQNSLVKIIIIISFLKTLK